MVGDRNDRILVLAELHWLFWPLLGLYAGLLILALYAESWARAATAFYHRRSARPGN
jgi:hypothetical protein